MDANGALSRHGPKSLPHTARAAFAPTFLNQERWKDTPPAGEPKKGESRLRQATPEVKLQAKFDQIVMELRRKPENHRKPETESFWIWRTRY